PRRTDAISIYDLHRRKHWGGAAPIATAHGHQRLRILYAGHEVRLDPAEEILIQDPAAGVIEQLERVRCGPQPGEALAQRLDQLLRRLPVRFPGAPQGPRESSGVRHAAPVVGAVRRNDYARGAARRQVRAIAFADLAAIADEDGIAGRTRSAPQRPGHVAAHATSPPAP